MRQETPIIVQMESQRVFSTKLLIGGGHRTTLEKIGVSADGRRWRFYSTRESDASGVTRIGMGYDYVPLTNAVDAPQ